MEQNIIVDVEIEKLSRTEKEQLIDLHKHPGWVLLGNVVKEQVRKSLELAVSDPMIEEARAGLILRQLSAYKEAAEWILETPERAKNSISER